MLRSDTQKSAKKATSTTYKSLTFYTLTALNFSAMARVYRFSDKFERVYQYKTG